MSFPSKSSADSYGTRGESLKGGPSSAASHAGTYLGVHLGAGFTDNTITDVDGYSSAPAGNVIDYDDAGFTAGFLVGHNLQFNNMVFGIEGDLTFGDLSTSTKGIDPIGLDETSATEYDWIATVRGRLGYSTGRLLVYGTGGIAFANFENRHVDLDGTPPTLDAGDSFFNSGTRTGWVAGGGLELLSRDGSWTGRAEALYMDFGDENNRVNFSGAPFIYNVENQVTIVRFAVTRKFGN